MLIASTWLSFAVKFAIPAWYAVSSLVQPPVNAAGKNARMTFFLPRKSDSLTATRLLVLLALTLKSGATSPTFSGVFGMVTFWAKAAVVAAAAKATMDRCFIFPFAISVISGAPSSPVGAVYQKPEGESRKFSGVTPRPNAA